ncbi:MAG: hypothetical protein M5U22_00745 [Thermoleophilia bacterium]|nr:hypothetical protein [Thermoleophilia bacterium]
MKKLALLVLVAVFVLGMAGTALAADPPVSDPTTGLSVFTYQDLADTSAKYEGGYAAFESGTLYTTNPHGGYDTTTNKCKVCHAVHRAEGAYYLLRADSQDDACDYCHIGGSAHSDKVVYTNGDPTTVLNGHTVGSFTEIPDSSVYQEAVPVVLSTTDANGDPVTETIEVRSYDAQKLSMYRFSRHHSQGAVGTGRSGFIKVGPLALRCMNCHQPHNAVNMVWRPRTFTPWTSATYNTVTDGPFASEGYKLLRRYPSATTTGAANAYGNYDVQQAVKVIEDMAIPQGQTGPWTTGQGNFSQDESSSFTYTENGVASSSPSWIAQDIHEPDAADYPTEGTGVYRYPSTVNTYALSYWCADCHNLDIGGWEPLTEPELGFKAHNERTHPAPYYGAYDGPGQCYSCHRNDLSTVFGNAGVYGGTATAALRSSSNSCTQCHYGTGSYYNDRADASPDKPNSDFPHSGSSNSIKLLGDYSITSPTAYTALTQTTITEDNLDAVCLRCHPGIGIHN